MRADLEWGTIPNVVLSQAERHPDVEALISDTSTWTFPQLRDAMLTAASAFLEWGIEPGDRVAIWAPNSAEWVIGALGALAVGAILVPVNTRFVGAEGAFVLAKSGAKALLTVGEFAGHDYVAALRDTGSDLTALERVVMLDDAARPETIRWSDFLHRAEDPPGELGRPFENVRARIAAIEPDDASDIMFTSGTTGKPKGVILTHGQSLRAFGEYASRLGLLPGDRAGIVPPFFHAFGSKGGWLAMLMLGGTTVPIAVLDPDDVIARIERQRLAFMPGPPTIHFAYLDHPRRADYDLSSLKAAMIGATAVPAVLVERLRSELGVARVLAGFGLTECTAIVTICHPDDSPRVLSTTCGKPVDGVEVDIRDDDGNPLARETRGEVYVRGYNVMKGYWDEPELTAEVIDAEGWLRTGDIGLIDLEGNLLIVDRKKDMVIVGGFNVYPAEVELVLRTHPAIENAAVVALPDERLGEVPVAFVVAHPGAEIDAVAFTAWCREHMANYKVPRQVALVDALPMNASMKVRKTDLREDATRRWGPTVN